MGLRSQSHESWQPVGQCPVIVLVLLICFDIYKYFPAIKFSLNYDWHIYRSWWGGGRAGHFEE